MYPFRSFKIHLVEMTKVIPQDPIQERVEEEITDVPSFINRWRGRQRS